MLSEILRKRFEEAKALQLQARGIDGYVHSRDDDLRVISFQKLEATIDLIPELLRDQTKPYQTISQLWFSREARNLSERVGYDFFPETASEFVWRLLNALSQSIPDQAQLRQIERWHLQYEDLAFGDPDPAMHENTKA